MVPRGTLRRTLVGRDVAVAYAVLVAVYLVRFVEFQPVQIPAYLLIVAYDLVEVALPFLTPFYPIAFPLFLYLLAVVAAGAAGWLAAKESERSAVARMTGGVCLVVGTLSLLFGGYVGGPLIASTDNPTPLAITGATGIVLLGVGWLLLGPTPSRLGSADSEVG